MFEFDLTRNLGSKLSKWALFGSVACVGLITLCLRRSSRLQLIPCVWVQRTSKFGQSSQCRGAGLIERQLAAE